MSRPRQHGSNGQWQESDTGAGASLNSTLLWASLTTGHREARDIIVKRAAMSRPATGGTGRPGWWRTLTSPCWLKYNRQGTRPFLGLISKQIRSLSFLARFCCFSMFFLPFYRVFLFVFFFVCALFCKQAASHKTKHTLQPTDFVPHCYKTPLIFFCFLRAKVSLILKLNSWSLYVLELFVNGNESHRMYGGRPKGFAPYICVANDLDGSHQTVV